MNVSCNDRSAINLIAPCLRVLLGQGDVPKLIRYEESAPARKDAFTLPPFEDGPPQQIVRLIAESLRSVSSPLEVVVVPGCGTFHVADPPRRGRVAGKVAVVTGAAQGIGLEIAQNLASAGATVALADINADGARQAARELCEAHGQGRAAGLAMDVTDDASVQDAFDEVVRTFGGLDVLIANAGVLKAQSVKTLPVKDFDFVTAVNYRGYFLCVQKAAPIMAAGRMARAEYTSDIIQINSKSGLVGSNRNAAYAGGKFGGIGLTQSFALELIEDGIKVNSICPGNFLNSPLWSDPENGLFSQYLRSGKVPGAKTVEDVRKKYEQMVPMKRGCTVEDLMKAVFYLIEQKYETGQALPVTGGQVMLH